MEHTDTPPVTSIGIEFGKPTSTNKLRSFQPGPHHTGTRVIRERNASANFFGSNKKGLLDQDELGVPANRDELVSLLQAYREYVRAFDRKRRQVMDSELDEYVLDWKRDKDLGVLDLSSLEDSLGKGSQNNSRRSSLSLQRLRVSFHMPGSSENLPMKVITSSSMQQTSELKMAENEKPLNEQVLTSISEREVAQGSQD